MIVFSVGIYSYLRSTGIGPGKFLQPKSPPVVAFVEACLEKTSTEAVRAMGDQGGYIEIPPAIAFNPTRHVSLLPGLGGEYAPKVPYWYYDGVMMVPSVSYMEVQTEDYVEQRMFSCLNNFTDLREEYIITERSNYSADVSFNDKETLVRLDYVIDIEPRGSDEVTTREEFLIKLDVPVRRMHELAVEILENENEHVFFENMTINLMGSHPSDQVPFTGMDFQCGRKTWLLSTVKNDVITALEPAVSAVRFRGTDHPEFEADDDDYAAVHDAVILWRESETKRNLVLPDYIPSDSYDYFQYYFPATEEKSKYKDLKVVSLFKKGWGMNFLATPNRYGVMKSGVQDLKSQILSFLCLNTYHFVYDVTYPVTININAPSAFRKNGFVFRYAFPVQIFHNAPHREMLPMVIIEPTEYGSEFCEFMGDEEHIIRVEDSVTNAEISRVNLTYRCLSEQCSLGSTRTNNKHLQWSGPFPDGCSGAIIVANKSGYLLAEQQFNGDDPFTVSMHPTQEVTFEVKRHPENAPNSAKRLDPDMYAIIQVEHSRPELAVFDVFGSEEIFNSTDSFELLRDDATYQVNIMLLQKISADEDKLIGGWIGNWTVTLEEMLDAEKVVFHVPQKYPPPQTDEELISTYKLMTNRTLFPNAVPEVIRSDEYTGEDDEAGSGVAAT